MTEKRTHYLRPESLDILNKITLTPEAHERHRKFMEEAKKTVWELIMRERMLQEEEQEKDEEQNKAQEVEMQASNQTLDSTSPSEIQTETP